MTKHIFLIFQLVIISFCIQAQIYVGAKVGLAPSTYSVSSYNDYSKSPNTLNNYLLGAVVEYPIIYGFSAQLEVQYVRSGLTLKSKRLDSQVSINQGDFFSEKVVDRPGYSNGLADEGERFSLPNLYENYEVNLGNLQNFLLFKYEFVGGSKGFYTEFGPALSYGLSGKRMITFVDKEGKEDSSVPLISKTGNKDIRSYSGVLSSYGYKIEANPFKDDTGFDLKRLDLGLALGGGMYLELGSSRMYLDLRFVLGLSDINKDGEGFTPIKSRSLQLSATYLFPVGE